MARCGFKTDIIYRDEKTGEYIKYECDEPNENILDSGLCKFHDENYFKDSKNEQKLKRILSKKLTEPEPLICIGYHLPNLLFANLHFDKSVNFSGAHFTEKAQFYGAQFTKEANFLWSSVYRCGLRWG